MSSSFGTWLQQEITKQGLTRREVARRLAAKHPEGLNAKTVESARRQIYKYLDPEEPTNPTSPTRRAFAEALGVDPSEVPSDDEEEGDLEAALLRACERRAVRQSDELRKWIAFGKRNGLFEREGVAA